MAALGGFTFATTHQALVAEGVLVREGVPVRLALAPRNIQSDCGYVLRFPWEERERLAALLAREGIEVTGAHPLD